MRHSTQRALDIAKMNVSVLLLSDHGPVADHRRLRGERRGRAWWSIAG
jgi:hypothetical protein